MQWKISINSNKLNLINKRNKMVGWIFKKKKEEISKKNKIYFHFFFNIGNMSVIKDYKKFNYFFFMFFYTTVLYSYNRY